MHDLAGPRSAARSPLRQIKYLYHFTDERNIAWIRALNGLHSLLRLQRYSRMVGIELPPAPGGDPKSHWLDKKLRLNEYVHLCFLPIHPMEVQARKEGRIHDPVFLQVPAQTTDTSRLRVVTTDRRLVYQEQRPQEKSNPFSSEMSTRQLRGRMK